MTQGTLDQKTKRTILLIFGPAILIMIAMFAFVVWNSFNSTGELLETPAPQAKSSN